jgi:hypothetical protein
MFNQKYFYVKLILIASVLLSSGCSGIFVTESNTFSSHKTYKLAYSNQKYRSQKLHFSRAHDLLTITSYDEVSILDLNNKSALKTITSPDSKITNSQFFDNGKKYLMATMQSLQIWNTENWKLSKQLIASRPSGMSGVSSDYKYLYFDRTVWQTSNYEKLTKNIAEDHSPNDLGFSKSNQYLATAGHYYGIAVYNLKSRQYLDKMPHYEGGVKVQFLDDDNFLASYGAKLDIYKGGYLAKQLGLFNVKSQKRIQNYSPFSRITCWVNDPDRGVLVSLFSGDIVFLDPQFNVTHKWHVDSPVNVCTRAENQEIWLGTEKSGVYKLTPDLMRLSLEYETPNSIEDLKISPDNKYLGLVESIPGATVVKVLY